MLSEVFFNQSWCLSVKKNCLRDPVLCDEKAYFSYITLYFKEWWRLCSFLLFNGRFVRAWVRAQKLVSHTWKCESGRPLLATHIFGSWRRQPWWAVTVALCASWGSSNMQFIQGTTCIYRTTTCLMTVWKLWPVLKQLAEQECHLKEDDATTKSFERFLYFYGSLFPQGSALFLLLFCFVFVLNTKDLHGFTLLPWVNVTFSLNAGVIASSSLAEQL